MLRPAMLFTVELACSPSPRDVDTAASTPDAGTVAFRFAWPDGRATVTRTWRAVGFGGEDSTLISRWKLTADRSGDALVLRSSNYEIVELAGQVGRLQVVDGRGALGDISVDASSGTIAEIAGREALSKHVLAMERARHSDPSDEGGEFRGRVVEAVASPEQLRLVIRSSWALFVGNLMGQTLTLTGEAPRRSKKTLAFGGGIVVDTLVERSVETRVPCRDEVPPSSATPTPCNPRCCACTIEPASSSMASQP